MLFITSITLRGLIAPLEITATLYLRWRLDWRRPGGAWRSQLPGGVVKSLDLSDALTLLFFSFHPSLLSGACTQRWTLSPFDRTMERDAAASSGGGSR